MNKIIYIMGVSGCGKTTIGELLSQQTGLPFFDGDQFHPIENIKKMTSGIPLTDEDRWPWLNSIRDFAKQQSIDSSIIIACSALKQTYREILSNIQNASSYFIYLKGSQSLLTQRLETRIGHYMTAQLLSSQLEILEIPKEALVVNIECSPSEMVTKIINELSLSYNMQEFGLIGLGVMGKSLSRNLAQKGVKLSLFNRFVKDKEENVAANFITQHPELNSAKAFENIIEFVASLALPRKIIIMVNAGNATDDIIEQLTPLLQANDVIIDGGNSLYLDTENRIERLKPMGIHLIGAGISGGEEGALNGPSIMPGGAIEAYTLVQSYLEKIAAINQNGVSCCQYIGGGGAGHFVKMVHNGIEYAEMQLLAELIQFLKIAGGFSYDLIALLLKPFLQTEKSSYLLEITIQILQKKVNGQLVLELILDNAGNKGTGSWTTIEAAKAGIPIPTLTAALNARFISALWQERQQASQKIATNRLPQPIDIHLVMDAYQLCRIINHQQGFHLISAVSKEKGWNIDLSNLASVWTAGCIIRSSLMNDLQKILSESSSLFFHPTVIQQINQLKGALKQTLELGLSNEVPMDCFSASAQYLFAYKQGVSGASIIQAQRDFFGAHTYQLKEDPTGPYHHTNWH